MPADGFTYGRDVIAKQAVMSATVRTNSTALDVHGLEEPVHITLPIIQVSLHKTIMCFFLLYLYKTHTAVSATKLYE